jgi:SAM-dependent methyltransferase
MPVDYSDGQAVEREILEILDRADHLGSATSIAPERYSKWPVRYHLCAERANLVRHLGFEGLDVLEFGAGMGGVSRFLAERSRSLTVIEGTEARFRALQSRLRDLDNWTGIVANIVDVRLEKTFDVVCVIGVLEYAELYVAAAPGESPFMRLLETAMRHLSDQGVLVLAIENKLGLKYWSGAAEDHLNALFAGVCDYPRAPSARTFSRRELLGLLHAVGASKVDEFFPFPDYKVPTSVISAAFAEIDPELAASVATAGPLDNQSGPRMRLFPEQLAAKSIARAGLLPEFANSFLLVASRTRDSEVRRRLLARSAAGEVGWHYVTSRQIPTITTFTATSGGPVEVEKSRLEGGDDCEEFRSPRSETTVRWHTIPRCRVTSGTLLRDRLLQDAYFERWSDFRSEFLRFLGWAIDTFSMAGEPGRLSGTSFDAIQTNVTVDADHTFRWFDLEWELCSPLPASWFVLRNVDTLWRNFEALSPTSGFSSLAEMYEGLCGELGCVPALHDDLAREADFRALVLSSSDYPMHLELLTDAFHRPFAVRGFPRTPDSEVIPRSVMREGDAALRSAEAEIESHRHSAQHTTRLLAAYQERDAVITYRLATKVNALLRRLPWVHGALKFAVRSALEIRARRARGRQT